MNPMAEYSVNNSGGTTISVAKRGGLKAAWVSAKHIAGWEEAAAPTES